MGVPKVTSAHFAGPLLLLVINYQVYIYNYQDNIWGKATGRARAGLGLGRPQLPPSTPRGELLGMELWGQ